MQSQRIPALNSFCAQPSRSLRVSLCVKLERKFTSIFPIYACMLPETISTSNCGLRLPLLQFEVIFFACFVMICVVEFFIVCKLR
ncbi:unnamed protein product [Ilex paraguariensis]|uniref:Uncharacterized protein n=1 Tax=Ilex paraguariensis TaxID=185542 RepID=A0ABC8S0H3_9AQUA